MKKIPALVGGLFGCALLSLFVACGTLQVSVPTNSTLLNDGQLLVDGLQAVDAALTGFPGVPAGDTTLASVTLTSVQTGLTALQKGAQTPAQFAQLAENELAALAPSLLTDLKANPTITAGVKLIEGLIPIIAGEVAQVTASPAPKAATDTRGRLRAWINSVR